MNSFNKKFSRKFDLIIKKLLLLDSSTVLIYMKIEDEWHE